MLDPLRVGWGPLGIQSLGLLGILYVLASLWGAKLVARGESSSKEWLNLFENSRACSVLPVITTLPLTVRRRWKVMTPACGFLGFRLALVKRGFGVGSFTGRVGSLRNSISRTLLGIPNVLSSLWGAKLVVWGESFAKESLNLFENN